MGHSYGGMVISGAGHHAAHLVYVAGVQPDRGESRIGLARRFAPTPLVAALRFSDDGAQVTVDPEAAAACFYTCCPPERAASYVARLRPTAAACLTDPFPCEPAWRTVASTQLVCECDRSIEPAQQEATAARANSTVVHHRGDHSPMLSAPGIVVALVAEIVERR